MPKARRSVGALVLAAVAGLSAWVSLGTMAVIDDRSLARIVALPPAWWLAPCALFAVGSAVAARLPIARAWPLAISLLLWLPYLPFPVPRAFLIWSGPIEGLVWIAVAAGVMGQARSAAWSRVEAFAGAPRRAPLLAAAIAAACSLGGVVSLRGVVPAGDEPHYLVITQSLLRDGDLLIENNHKRGDYQAYFTGDMAKADYIVRADDGQIYSIHSPGISVLVLPGFAVAGYPGAVATVILCTAAASALAWYTAWLLTASIGGAWFAWAAVFLTAPYFFQTFTIFPDGVGGLLTMAGIWLLAQFEMRRSVGRWQLFLVGVVLALLPWFHTRFSILAAGCGAVLVARLLAEPERTARVMAFIAAPVISAMAWFSYFWIIWGTPNPAAPYGTETNTAVGNIGRGLAGLLIDQQFGLIANAPIYGLAVVGMVALARHRKRLAFELIVIAAPYMLATSAFHMWWGGVSAPARFLSALMPLATIPLAWWWRQFASQRTFGLALLLLSVVLVAPVVLVDGNFVHNDRDGFSLLLDWASTNVDLPMAFPSLHRGTIDLALRDAGVWMAAGLVVLVASAVARTWTATVWSAAIVAMFAASAAWAINAESAVTINRSQVALLNSWHPAWQTSTIRLRPFRILTDDEFSREIEVGSTDRVRRQPTDPTMLKAASLPAGDYDVIIRGSRTLAGELLAGIGNTDQVSDRWRLDGHQPGSDDIVLRLPVAASTTVLRADPEARASISALTLRLKSLKISADPSGRQARSAIRYGNTRAFFLDDRAYMEGGGFWTRGAALTTVVIDADANTAPPTIWLQSGPIATSADLSAGNWTEHVTLEVQSRTSVNLPAPTGDHWVVRIQSGPAFRPIDIASGNQDARPLGVWVELR